MTQREKEILFGIRALRQARTHLGKCWGLTPKPTDLMRLHRDLSVNRINEAIANLHSLLELMTVERHRERDANEAAAAPR